MAVQENTLGAPTEGLGQTVTFAGQGRRVPTTGAVGSNPLRTGIQGGQSAGLLGSINPGVARPDASMAFLTKVAQDVTAGMAKKAREESFVSGMHAAASGMAIGEIAESAPWYNKIFGESVAVQGARAFTQQAKSAELSVQLEEAMPELRKQSPEQAHAYFKGLVSTAMTGDAATDAAIMNSMSRTLPSAMRRHTREHYLYQQEQANEGQSTMLLSGAKALQAKASNLADEAARLDDPAARDELTADFELTEAVPFAQLVQPIPGQDIEAWKKARTQDIMLMAEQGQFHAITALRKAGVLDTIGAKNAALVERSIQANEGQARIRALSEYEDKFLAIRKAAGGEVGMSQKKLAAMIDGLNADYKTKSGNSMGLIGTESRAAFIDRLDNAIERERERNARIAGQRAAAAAAAGDTKAEELEGTNEILSRLQTGSVGQSELKPAIRKKLVSNLMQLGLFNAGPSHPAIVQGAITQALTDPDEIRAPFDMQVGLLNRASGMLANGVTPEAQQQFLGLYQNWRKIAERPEGRAATRRMYRDWDDRLAAFDSVYRTSGPGAGQQAAAFAHGLSVMSMPPVRTRLSKDDAKAVAGAVNTVYGGSFMGLVSGEHGAARLSPQAQGVLTRIAISRVEDAAGDDIEERTERVLKGSDDVQVVGRYAWQSRVPLIKRLKDLVPDVALAASDKISKAEVSDFLTARLKAAKMDPGSPSLRFLDTGTELVATHEVDGEFVILNIPLKDMADNLKKNELKRRGTLPPEPHTGGIGPTWAPLSPGHRSPYAKR